MVSGRNGVGSSLEQFSMKPAYNVYCELTVAGDCKNGLSRQSCTMNKFRAIVVLIKCQRKQAMAWLPNRQV